MSQAIFPKLKTGAGGQYPLKRSIAFQTEVFSFVDGSEQRLPLQKSLTSWELKLQDVSPAEYSRIHEMFSQTQAGAQLVTFDDPIDDTRNVDCRLSADELTVVCTGEGRVDVTVRLEEGAE